MKITKEIEVTISWWKILGKVALFSYETFMTGCIMLAIQKGFITPIWHVVLIANMKVAMYAGTLLMMSVMWHVVPHIPQTETEEQKLKEIIMQIISPAFALLSVYMVCYFYNL